MSILLGSTIKVIVQGITGKAGGFHAAQMLEYGTPVVAGVTPGRGGERWEKKLPIFDSVAEAAEKTGATATGIFVPAPFGADAILEAAAAGLELIVVITEGIPARDMARVKRLVRQVSPLKNGPVIIGPNGPGLITPGQAKIGIMPGYIHTPGPVGLVSRSGTLTYEAVWQLTQRGLGQSTCVGIGGDSIPGTGFIEVLERFEKDPATKAVVLIGEIGGSAEEAAADYIREHFSKPVVAFVAGATAPKEKRMGHAGAVIAQGQGTHESKIKALKAAGVSIARNPSDIGETMAELFQNKDLIPALQ
ncbi:MAG: succinate--CoA ligase subunit alpha [Candidatus Omnitrophica bacterium CG11_big_fil_rev_8_21_14_0_20_64_10]|nr:MAG: succinate--CoA ligase subunit alpha [Candidatus Omnitrophica bacterium CG11_big_fil_rev_8_21_14_0_20_64_10]